METHSHDAPSHDIPAFWRSRAGAALAVLGAVAAFFLLTEHWAHVLGVLPYLLVLACPLMHVFMHHGHDHHHGTDKPPQEKSDER